MKLSKIGEESYEKKSELFEAIFDIKLPKSTAPVFNSVCHTPSLKTKKS